jgi:hypothetical protein
MSKDYIKAFARLMDATYLRYKGCLIEVYPDGFKWSNTLYPTKDEVYAAIDAAFPILENSLNRLKK